MGQSQKASLTRCCWSRDLMKTRHQVSKTPSGDGECQSLQAGMCSSKKDRGGQCDRSAGSEEDLW